MLERSQWGKNDKHQYDPQVGAAAQANAAIAQKAESWNEDFYAQHVAPLLEASAKATEANTRQQGELFDLNKSQATLQDQRYRQLGIPAEDAYYKMVKDYSAPDEENRQATRALGDQRTAEQSQSQQLMRKFSGIGIDPTSPAALSAMSDQAVQNSAAEAGAATRARDAAKTLGMALTGDAANFGRGGQSGILGFGAAASGNSTSAAGVAQGAIGAASNGASNMNTGLGLASRAYGANLDAYTKLNAASMDAQAQSSQGAGQLLGLVAQAAITHGSDRRIKRDIRKVADLAHGIGLYVFHYLWDAATAPLRIGYMADEVVKVFPHAVHYDRNGYARVDYSKVQV